MQKRQGLKQRRKQPKPNDLKKKLKLKKQEKLKRLD